MCKYPIGHWRRRREAARKGKHYGFGYVAHAECEKGTKEVCNQEPVVEEKTQEHDLCRYEPKKECEEKTVKVPKLVCPQPEKKEEEE